ncbi:MAG TPA: PQQ-dependent dehydrogenase, methanol/ethanol family [Steroidobacteraceae bacterium]|jgi:PQQ-dependent dehydrogenase (methanol/ethanol family)|nr:PQQ-dependent dehydrogenase, methanol/ethanol family [Steroidobacteraceae bacterium]
MRFQITRRVLQWLPVVTLLAPVPILAQTVPAGVPADEVFSREQIGHALAPPTPGVGRTAPSSANAPEDDGQWRMPSKNYASTRYSTLAEITPENVAKLTPQFSFSLAVNKGQEAAPIVADNVMYLVTAYPNIVYALDLSKPGAPMKWKFASKPLPASQGVACCDVVNRGGTVDAGKFIFNTLDGQTIALNIKDGRPVWRTRLGNIHIGETITMAPLVADGRVFVGDSGGELGVRGWIAALDESHGKLEWRAYNTGPDADVKIGPDFHPYYPSDKGTNLGVTTWPADAWRIGGATVWGWVTYDPELKALYYGVGNPGPWNADQRPGDNKWTTGIFARDPATGNARWYYQMTPHDEHDYDGVNEQILLDMPFGGRMHKVLIHPDRNGYVYVIDRTNGQVLSADPYGPVNSSKGVDLATGRLIVNPDKETKVGREVHDICPTASGAKDWNPSSFSPQTGLMYIPHENICMDWTDMEVSYIVGTPYVGANVHMKPGPGGHRGELTAWDPVNRRPAWIVNENFPIWSGTVVTAGNVVFYGTMDGWFKAVDAQSGKALWQYKVDSGIIGQPISYRGPDGHQYIAVLSGVGGWSGAVVSGPVDPRDGSAALGMVNVMSDLPKYTTAGGTLYVFALPH